MNIDVVTYLKWSAENDMADETCWTFLSKVLLENYGIEIPRFVGALADAEQEAEAIKRQELEGDWKEIESPKAGDVVLFTIGGKRPHVGICTGPILFIHFSRADRTVKVDEHSALRWRNRVVGFYRKNN